MDADALYAMVAETGSVAWRVNNRPETGGVASRVAAHQYRTVFRLLDRELEGGGAKRVLDWGCGAAAFSYMIASSGNEVWGTDYVVPPMAEYVTKQTDHRFTYVKAEHPTELPFDDGFFEVVLSNGCLEHVAESGGRDLDSLQEIVRVLKPGGAFVCTHLPNERSYIEAAARALRGPVRKYLHYPMYAHTALYSRERVVELAAACGLQVTSFEAYGALPRNPLSLLPRSVSDATWFVDSVDRLDDRLGEWGARYCQNFAWVGRKPAAP